MRQLVHCYVCPPDCQSTQIVQSTPFPTDNLMAEFPVQVRPPEDCPTLDQIESLENADDALQEQLSKLDENAELHRSETNKQKAEIEEVSAGVKALRNELKQSSGELEQLRSTVDDQRAEYERILASLEGQLVEALAAYE